MVNSEKDCKLCRFSEQVIYGHGKVGCECHRFPHLSGGTLAEDWCGEFRWKQSWWSRRVKKEDILNA